MYGNTIGFRFVMIPHLVSIQFASVHKFGGKIEVCARLLHFLIVSKLKSWFESHSIPESFKNSKIKISSVAVIIEYTWKFWDFSAFTCSNYSFYLIHKNWAIPKYDSQRYGSTFSQLKSNSVVLTIHRHIVDLKWTAFYPDHWNKATLHHIRCYFDMPATARPNRTA